MSTTYYIWHIACRIPFNSSGGASRSSSCCCCCRHTSCFKPHDAYPIPHPPHTGIQREITENKTTLEPKKPTTPTNTRPTWRETTGNKTISEPKKPITPTNTQPPHKGKQRETKPLQNPRSGPHQPTPTPHMKGDNGRQNHFRAQEANYANQHPPHIKGDNGRQYNFKAQDGGHTMKGNTRRQWEITGDKTTLEPKKPTPTPGMGERK